MRNLVRLVLLLCASFGVAHASCTSPCVQETSGTSFSATSIAQSYTSSVTTGNTLLAFGFFETSSAISVSDNVNGAWTQDICSNPLGSAEYTCIFRFSGSAPGSVTVTASFSGSTGNWLDIVEVSGLATASPLDGSPVSATGFGGSTQSVPLTTASDGDFIYGGIFDGNSSLSCGTGFNCLMNSGLVLTEYAVQATHGAFSFTFNNSSPSNGGWEAAVAAYKASGGGSTNPPHGQLPLAGVGN